MASKQPFNYARRAWARRQAMANMAIEGIFYTPEEIALVEKADREGRNHDEIRAALLQIGQTARTERS